MGMQIATYIATRTTGAHELAERLGVSAEAVRLWSRGKRTPRPEMMRKIFEVTDGAVTPNDFMAFSETAE